MPFSSSSESSGSESDYEPEESNGTTSEWGYKGETGPENWGSIREEWAIANTGEHQSPIDLSDAVPETYTPLQFTDAYFEDIEGALFNNGHTVEFEVEQPNELIMTEGPFMEEKYKFLQLHFHWGSKNKQGCEHTIEGKRYSMEMHMVHINSKYLNDDGSVDPVAYQTSDGLAVLGFMFKVKSSEEFEPINSVMSEIETLKFMEINEKMHGVKMNLGEFLKQVLEGGFFSYSGSLTTPGCNECVNWLVFKKPIKIAKDQIKSIRKIKDQDGHKEADNFRPVQNRNDRIVTFSFAHMTRS